MTTATTLGPAADAPVRWHAGTRQQRIIAAYLVLGVLTVPGYFLGGEALSAAAYLVCSALPLAALIIGVRMHRPRAAAPWYLLGAGQAAFFVADLSWYFVEWTTGAEVTFPSLPDAAYLVGYPLIAAGIVMFIWRRSRGPRVAPVVDALAVGVAGGVLLWVGAVELSIHDLTVPLTDKLILIGYQLGDALLLGGAAYMLLATRRAQAAEHLIAMSLALLLVADLLYSGMLVDFGGYEVGIADLLWMGSYLAFGLAALLPSMRSLTEPVEDVRVLPGGGNLLVLAAALVAVPLAAVVQALSVGHVDIEAVVAAEAILGILLMIRLQDLAHGAVHQERRFASLVASASDAFLLVAADGTVTYDSPAAARVLGDAAEYGRRGANVFDAPVPDGSEPWVDWLAAVFSTPGASRTAEFNGAPDGAPPRWIRVTGTNRSDDPEVGGIVMNFHDVTSAREATRNLERLKTAMDQASEGVVVTDAESRIEYVNPAFERISGHSSAQLIGKNPRILNSGVQPPSFYQAMWATLLAGNPWVADFTNRRADGSTFEAASIISPIRDEQDRPSGYVAVIRDVTDERRTERRADQAARERALIADTIRNISLRGTPEETVNAICQQVASMQDVATTGLFIFEPDGQAAPYGFAIPGLEDAPMRRVPRRRTDYLRERAERGPWIEAWESRPWHPYDEVFQLLGVRAIAYAPVRDGDDVIGFIHISSPSPQAEERLSDAMPALVEFAEIAGAIIGPSVAARSVVGDARRRMQAIIDEGRFTIAFQPIVDLRRDEIVGYEALARFDDGVSPDARFAEAEAVGVGPELELATIRAALELAEQLPAGPWLNVNVSPTRVLDADGQLAALVSPCPRPIVLEVTEHAAIADYVEFRHAVTRLGPCVRIAVDDAGAGFSSLRHILELRPAFVKLDRALIAGLEADEARRALVAGLRHFADGARCRLIAEGVETVDELAALRQLDVALGQGYLLGRPTEIGAVEEPVRPEGRAPSVRRAHAPTRAAAAASASERSSVLT